jgi:hypothetical protein
LKLRHEEELHELNSSTDYFERKHVHANETDGKKQLQKLILQAESHGCKA